MILGHKTQWKFLTKSLEFGKLPHALLFSGQEKLGKRHFAFEFAKFLNCSSGKKPCDNCKNCQDIQKRFHPDLIYIEPQGKEIPISAIRDLILKMSLHAYLSVFKIAIIDKAHLMNQEAQNCFLKLLEEPKGKTLLILITEYPGLLLPTIISRVQEIKFFPVKKEEIKEYLSLSVPKEKAEKLADLSFSKPGLALDYLLNEDLVFKKEGMIKDLIEIKKSDLAFRFNYVKDIFSKEEDVFEILNTWLFYLRGLIIKGETKDKVKLKKTIESIQETITLLSSTNTNSKLAFETLLMEL